MRWAYPLSYLAVATPSARHLLLLVAAAPCGDRWRRWASLGSKRSRARWQCVSANKGNSKSSSSSAATRLARLGRGIAGADGEACGMLASGLCQPSRARQRGSCFWAAQ